MDEMKRPLEKYERAQKRKESAVFEFEKKSTRLSQ